ncbi:hypothetical protein PoB_003738000 [Plakobranchus ocellatus]|uniref:Uncharacterized protein n=1 Tax=Plakobranchus ocellatus TaxID=259542 RepID=A0AAV4AVF6_9GAST|nr:hypothetical protein PoB_003738000 [Plakobranchus ocellatus]
MRNKSGEIPKYTNLAKICGGSSGRAVGYQVRSPSFESQFGLYLYIIAPVCPPSPKWVARSSESKGGEESNGKLPHDAVYQEQSGPYFWFSGV